MSLLSAVHLALFLESPFHAGTTTCIKVWERLFMPADHLHLQLIIVIKCTGFDCNLDLCMSDPCYINCRHQVSMKTKRAVVAMDILVWKGHHPPIVGGYVEIVIIVVAGVEGPSCRWHVE